MTATSTTDLILDAPPLTALQIASALAITKESVKQQLRDIPATGTRAVGQNRANTWDYSALPGTLRARLSELAFVRGFSTPGEMFRSWVEVWKPRVPLSEVREDCHDQAVKLRAALVPSLRAQFLCGWKSDFERDGIADYAKVFGRAISTTHFRNLLARTLERDRNAGNYDRLELYLPLNPNRKPKPAAKRWNFPRLNDAIEITDDAETIWGLCAKQYRELRRNGEPHNRAVRELLNFVWERKPIWSKKFCLAPSRETLTKTFWRKLEKFQFGVPLDTRKDNAGRKPNWFTEAIEAEEWFIPAAQFFYLLSNCTHNSGSVPEALRWVIELPNLPAGWNEQQRRRLLKAICQNISKPIQALPTCLPEIRKEILARRNTGRPLVPERIAEKIIVNKSLVTFSRAPREWKLANQCAPGSQRRYTNSVGERVMMRPGDWFGGDDATPGIAVCVPCTDDITPVSRKFGVLLGRFQWLAYHDCRTDKILAWDYVVRPRGSYRAEDILNGMGAVVRTHGIPSQGFQFEGGTFNSKLVQQAIKHLGCQHWRTYSPHAKSIEAVFNKVWTRLAIQFPHADMGRYRNENESNCKLYEACKAGHKDPRQYFPPLNLLMAVFEEEVKYHNEKLIKSRHYGQWVPDQLFQAEVSARPLRALSPKDEWMFAPYAAERTVRGMMVGCRVPMFENFSVPFEFGADWLPLHAGKKVRLHFNPNLPKCIAKVVLLEKSGDKKPGDILGDAHLIGETAGNIRQILNWGDDNQRAGYLQRQRVGNFIRRETRAIGTAGRVEYARSEQRDGLTKTGIVERGCVPNAAEDGSENSQRELKRLLADQVSPNVPDSTSDRAARHAELVELRNQTAHLFA